MNLLALIVLVTIAVMLPPLQKQHSIPTVLVGNQRGAKSVKKYLGAVRNPDGVVLYQAMTYFYTVRGAVVLHGHSRVLFFDKNWKQLAYCEFGTPDELPTKPLKNNLYFNYVGANNQSVEHRQLIGSALPKQLCAEPNASCYPLFKE